MSKLREQCPQRNHKGDGYKCQSLQKVGVILEEGEQVLKGFKEQREWGSKVTPLSPDAGNVGLWGT